MEIIDELKKYLDEDIYKRGNADEVMLCFKKLNVTVSSTVSEFYTNFAGPFWEESMGLELLDIIEDKNNIENLSLICRDKFGFPNKYLILTELAVNEVVVLDSESDKLYRVDFEGGDRTLLNGTLKESWNSFEDFLREYFVI